MGSRRSWPRAVASRWLAPIRSSPAGEDPLAFVPSLASASGQALCIYHDRRNPEDDTSNAEAPAMQGAPTPVASAPASMLPPASAVLGRAPSTDAEGSGHALPVAVHLRGLGASESEGLFFFSDSDLHY